MMPSTDISGDNFVDEYRNALKGLSLDDDEYHELEEGRDN